MNGAFHLDIFCTKLSLGRIGEGDGDHVDLDKVIF